MKRAIFRSLVRGTKNRCPACGEGALLAGYLKPHSACPSCEEDFSAIRADDGPAWITIMVLGHVIVPLMLILGRDDRVPIWLAISALSLLMVVGVYVVLPRAKGMFIALIWATGATGEDMQTHNSWQQTDQTHNRLD